MVQAMAEAQPERPEAAAHSTIERRVNGITVSYVCAENNAPSREDN